MNELTRTFLDGLHCLLNNHYEPSMVARYAYEFYLDHDIEDKNLEYVVDYLKGIDAGPEFELTESEFRSFIKENLS